MATRSPSGVVGAVALAGALLAAAVQLQAARERAYPAAEVSEDSLTIRSASTVRRMTGPYNALFADVYWIRAIQYYGGTKQQLDAAGARQAIVAEPPPSLAADAFPVLYPLLDITTTLDPRFNIAYRFGSVFLAEPYPRGADRPDLAIALLEKGVRERPDKWQYLQDIGFVHYWFRHDFRAAAEWFQKAADVPGAPWWLRSLAATTLAQGGDRQSSRAMWTAILQTTEIGLGAKGRAAAAGCSCRRSTWLTGCSARSTSTHGAAAPGPTGGRSSPRACYGGFPSIRPERRST